MTDRAWNSTLPRRRTPLKRRKRVNPVNTRRAAERREKANLGLREYVRGLPCILVHTGKCWGPVAACHVESKGANGVVDENNLFPGCTYHHIHEQHQWGIPEFQRRHGLDLKRIARKVTGDYRQHG